MAGLRDMVKMTVSGIPGIGPITVGAAVPGFLSFAEADVADGTVVSYGVGDGFQNGTYTIWEVGRGTYSGGSFARTTPLWSSDGGTAVSLSASAVVWITVLAEDLQAELGGNVAGVTTISLADVTLVGGSNVTLSGDTGAITFSAADGITSGNFSAVGNTTGTTSSMTHALATQTLSGAGIVSVGFDAGNIVISATGATSATSMGFSAIGNTTGTTSSMTQALTAQTLSGAGIASIGFDAGSIVVSVPAGGGSATSMGLTAVGNTTGTTSSQTHALTGSTLSGAGIVSVGFNAGSMVISASSSQSVQSLGLFAVGGTAGSTTSETVDARTISFVGSGVASVGYSNGSIVISSPAAAATNPLLSLYAVGNTTDSTSSGANAPGSLSLAGAGAVSVGISNSSVVISAAASATSMGLTAAGNTTGSTSSMTHAITAETLSGAGAVSVGFSAGFVVISAPAQSAAALNIYAVSNTTDSTTSSPIVAGSLSFAGAGIAQVGISGSSVVISATSASSATSMGLSAVGNTTGTTSSMAHAITGEILSGAGIVSVGFNAGSVVISATAAAQTAAGLNIYAVGNTTDSTTSGAIGAGSLSFAGAGVASVGISNSSVVISVQSGVQSVQTIGGFATGNTVGASSSTTFDARSVTISGGGAVSVGYSTNNILIVSAPSGANLTVSYLEGQMPLISAGSVTIAGVAGAMQVGLINPPATLSFNQVRYYGSFGYTSATLSVTTNIASRTATASHVYQQTHQMVIYTRVDATTFSSLTNAQLVWGATSSWSVSQNSNSISVTLSGTYLFGAGSATSQSTGSTSVSTNTSSAVAMVAGGLAFSTSLTGVGALAIPLLTTIGSGPQLLGLLAAGTATTTAAPADLLVAAGAFNFSMGLGAPVGLGQGRLFPLTPKPFWYGAGSTSTVGSTAPVSIVATALVANSGVGVDVPLIQMGML